MRLRLLLIVTAACVAAASFTTTANAAPVDLKLKPKKAKARGTLTPRPFTVPANERFTIHTDGTLTFTAKRKRVRITDVELAIDPIAVVVTGKIGVALHPLFLGRWAIAIDSQTGAVSSGAIKLSVLSSARAAINKGLGFKRGKGMPGGRIGTIAFSIPGKDHGVRESGIVPKGLRPLWDSHSLSSQNHDDEGKRHDGRSTHDDRSRGCPVVRSLQPTRVHRC